MLQTSDPNIIEVRHFLNCGVGETCPCLSLWAPQRPKLEWPSKTDPQASELLYQGETADDGAKEGSRVNSLRGGLDRLFWLFLQRKHGLVMVLSCAAET